MSWLETTAKSGTVDEITAARRAGSHHVMGINVASGIYADKLRNRAPLWRRLWFLVSFVPRYLITGLVEVP